MTQLTPAAAVARAKAAWKRKGQWDSTLGDAMRIVHPHRDTFHQTAAGQKKEGTGQSWDATAALAAGRGATQLMGLTPAFEDWLELEPGPAVLAVLRNDPARLEEARTMLQSLSGQINALLQTGEFGAAVHEMWIDYLYSTGAMIVDNGTDPLGPIATFRTIPLSEFTLEEGPDGKPDTWHRRFRLAGRQIKEFWDDAKIPEALARRIETKPDGNIELFEITYRDRDEAELQYRYEVFWSSGGNHHRLVERQERTTRWITPRNAKVAGEELGRGPLLQSMPDIRTLNTVVEMTFRAASLALLGLYTSTDDDESTNRIKLRPGAIIKVRSNGGPTGPSLQRLDDPALRLDFANILVENLRASIKQALFDDALPPETGAVRSATEIVQRMRQLAVDLGGTYGRIVNEFVVPLVRRLIDILVSKGIAPTRIVVDNFFVRVKVSSPVARAQQLGKVEDIVRWLEILMAIGGREAVLVNAVVEEIFAELARLLGIPERLVRPAEQRKEAMAKLQQMAQAQIANENVAPRAAGGVPERQAA